MIFPAPTPGPPAPASRRREVTTTLVARPDVGCHGLSLVWRASFSPRGAHPPAQNTSAFHLTLPLAAITLTPLLMPSAISEGQALMPGGRTGATADSSPIDDTDTLT